MLSQEVCWCKHSCCEQLQWMLENSFWDCQWEPPDGCDCHEPTEEDVDGFELLGLSLEDLYGD